MNNIIKTIYKNFSYLLSAEVIIRIMTLTFTIYFARSYGSEKFGIYTLALSIGNLFEIFFNFGIGTIFIQKIAAENEKIKTELEKFLPLRLILSFCNLICSTIFIFILNKSQETFSALIIASFYFTILSVLQFLWICFDARQKMQYSAIVKLISYTIIFITGLLFIIYNYPVSYIVSSYLISIIVCIPITLFLLRKDLQGFSIKLQFNKYKEILKEGWPISLSGAFVFIYNYLDTIVISIIKGEQAVGIYQVSYKITGTLFILSQLINQTYLPALINTDKKSKDQLEHVFNNSIRDTFFWSIPITFGATILADRIILFVFGPDYSESIAIFKILIWNCIIYFLSSSLTNFLYAVKEQKKTMKVFFLGALFNTISNIYVIPHYGIMGAATTTVIAEVVVLLGMYLITKKHVKIKIISNIWQPLLASIVMTVFIFLVKLDSLILEIILGGLIYFGTYFSTLLLTKTIDKQKIINQIKTINPIDNH